MLENFVNNFSIMIIITDFFIAKSGEEIETFIFEVEIRQVSRWFKYTLFEKENSVI